MFAALLLSASMVSQAPPPLIARPDAPTTPPAASASAPAKTTAKAEIQRTIEKRREAQAKKKAARINRALNARYEAAEERLHQEKMAPYYLQQRAADASAFYQAQAGAAMQDFGIAARQNAETYRMRAIGQYGPGYLPVLNVPPVVTPTEVINRLRP